jgi:cell division protein FtsZ
VAGVDDLSLFEVNEAAEVVRQAAADEANIIFGATVDERLAGQVWVTVVATGLGEPQRRRTLRQPTALDDTLDTPSFLRDTPA